jgi:hypothetical protein
MVTVTGERYRHMLEGYLEPQLEKLQVSLKSVWFQQDGAKAHTAVPPYLQGLFPGIIAQQGPLAPMVWRALRVYSYPIPTRGLGGF